MKGPVLPDGGSSATRNEVEREPPAEPRTVVEYCVHNLPSVARDHLAGLDAETRGLACLERCGTCRSTPFLVVDGDLHTAASHAALAETLREVGP